MDHQLHTVYLAGRSAISALGNTVEEHMNRVSRGISGLAQHTDESISPEHFWASRIDAEVWARIRLQYGHGGAHSRFASLCMAVAHAAITESGVDVRAADTILILSSTKANIEALGAVPDEQTGLSYAAKQLKDYFKAAHQPLVVSNACISGAAAQLMAKRLLERGVYRHAVVIGCDVLSGFVFQGFRGFHAIASGPCRPFDKDRAGINLGEAAACMVLSVDPNEHLSLSITGAAASNDANHLSGPSRTGSELAAAIGLAMVEAGRIPEDIGMISAHGTATLYNDEMESKALDLAGLSGVGLHSLKSFIGHTLGAAGVIESVLACEALQQQVLLPSLGFTASGVPAPVHVVTAMTAHVYEAFVKTASGFGGCNAALVWEKVNTTL